MRHMSLGILDNHGGGPLGRILVQLVSCFLLGNVDVNYRLVYTMGTDNLHF